MAPPTKSDNLQHAIIDVFREQIRQRYLAENCRRFPELDAISNAKLDALRDFFLECIYPASKDRDRLDDAFDRMGEIIRSPKRMVPLMSMAFKSVWKLGRMFPSAVSAGKNTLEAYIETRKLEDTLLAYATKHKLPPESIGDHDIMVRMVASLPETEMTSFRDETLKLFHHLSNVKLLEATVEIMRNSKGLMESRPDLYHEEELAGFALGHEVLTRGLALFRSLDPAEFPIIIRGIEVVEIDWYHRIKAEAAGLDAGA
ncbi:MAG: hypothetical protein SGI88_15255 [Candidatus Hydrogenedentes bacterium]|nr:hypothetical protein [Candidatus Hydrogenedentota bacterium]